MTSKNVFLFSYNQGSAGAKELSEALGIKRIKHKFSGFRPSADKIVINWGASEFPEHLQRAPFTVLNPVTSVRGCIDKLVTFGTLQRGGVTTPSWTESRTTAVLWLREGDDVCARTKLRASGGDGLVLVRSEDDHGTLPDAQLYTKYVPKKDEYRVHVCGEEIIGIQRKAARKEFDGTVNWQVRSHDNGFVFLHIPPEEWSTVPADVLLQSELAFTHMGLDFGAVDVIWNNKRKKAYVLEINSAPGLEGHTIQIYKNGLERLIQNKQRPAR